MDQIQIGRFIATCRKKEGLTQNQLAEQLGITNKAISKWETGRSMPDVSLFIPLCDILNISLNELIAGEYIPEEKLLAKSEEALMEVLLYKKRSLGYLSIMQTISSLMMGIGTAVIFVPTFKDLGQAQEVFVIFAGLIAIYAGMIGKIRYNVEWRGK